MPLINTKEQIPLKIATNAYRAELKSEHSFEPSLADDMRVWSFCSLLYILQSDMTRAKAKSSIGQVLKDSDGLCICWWPSTAKREVARLQPNGERQHGAKCDRSQTKSALGQAMCHFPDPD